MFAQAVTGQEECVETLLQQRASVCVRDIRGRTPLHLASACGHAGVLGTLLQSINTSHTHTNLTDSQGYTPLHWACYNGTTTHWKHMSASLFCLKLPQFSIHVCLPFFRLCSLTFLPGYDACVELLLDKEVFRTIKGNSFSPLHCAV